LPKSNQKPKKMKIQKVKLGLVALILGFGLVITQSAFTPKAETLYVQTSPGVFEDETTAGGSCIAAFSEVCKYVLTPNSDPQDPESYTPSPSHTDQRWIP
jgi:hypothetical protein